MQCNHCRKEMDRDDDKALTIKGVTITVKCDNSEDIEYMNTQLGKYSDGKGECNVAICYECFIDLQLGGPCLMRSLRSAGH